MDVAVPNNEHIEARAALSSYLALGLIWFILAVCMLFLQFVKPTSGAGQGALIASSVGVLWCLWLRGFKLILTPQSLSYRNGFYQEITIPINQISIIEEDPSTFNSQVILRTKDPALSLRLSLKPFPHEPLDKILRKIFEKFDLTNPAKYPTLNQSKIR